MNEDVKNKHMMYPDIGTKVIIVGDHPWRHSVGTIIEYGSWMGKSTCVVELDNFPIQAGVTDPRQIRVLDD